MWGRGTCTYNYVCEVWEGQVDAIVCGSREVHAGIWMVAEMSTETELESTPKVEFITNKAMESDVAAADTPTPHSLIQYISQH